MEFVFQKYICYIIACRDAEYLMVEQSRSVHFHFQISIIANTRFCKISNSKGRLTSELPQGSSEGHKSSFILLTWECDMDGTRNTSLASVCVCLCVVTDDKGVQVHCPCSRYFAGERHQTLFCEYVVAYLWAQREKTFCRPSHS